MKNLICNNLKRLRERLNIGQEEMAAMMGVHLQTYSRYERGKLIPGTDKLTVLAEKAKVSLNWLITGDGEMRATEIREAPESYSGAKAAACPFPPQLAPEEWRLLTAFHGLTEDQQKDKLFEIEALAARNESRTEEGGGSDSAGMISA